jgi:hypothetical protein
VKAGDTVRLIGIPANLRDDEELATRALFEKCVGQTFVVDGLEQVEGLPYPLARIDVGDVVGEERWKHTIWVEPEYLQVEFENC